MQIRKFGRRSIVGVPTPKEAKKITDTPADAWNEKRAKLVCCLLLDGVHREELENIALPDLRLHLGMIRVPGGIAPISRYTVEAIYDYFEVRLSRSDNLTLFTDNRDGSPVKWQNILDMNCRRFWCYLTIGRPLSCNEFLSFHVRKVRTAHPHLTVKEIGKLCRISRVKTKWLLGINTTLNRYHQSRNHQSRNH